MTIPLAAGIGSVETQSEWTAAATVLLVLSVYSGARIAYELGRCASRWFVLVFHSFAYVFLGVVPLAQIGARTLLWAVDPTAGVLLDASVVCLVGVLLFDLGLWFGASRALSRTRIIGPSRATVKERRDPQPGQSPDSRDGKNKYSADRALTFLVAMALLSVVLLWTRGGLELVLASRNQMEAALCPAVPSGDLAQCGVVSALIHVPPVILTLVALGLRNRGHRALVWLALITGIVSLFLTANPVSTARFWFGATAIGLFGVTLGRSLRPRVLIWLAMPALLIIVFPSLDFGRLEGGTSNFSIQPDAIVLKQDFDAFQQVANGVTYVAVFGTRGGMQIASAVLFAVPRRIWTEKAPATGTLVTTSLGRTDNTNVSAPLWEEAYVDFGLGGVAVILGGLGYLVAILEAAVQASGARSGGLTGTLAPFFAGYGMFLLRGSLLPAIGPLGVAFLLVWLVGRSGIRDAKIDEARGGSENFKVRHGREATPTPSRGAHG